MHRCCSYTYLPIFLPLLSLLHATASTHARVFFTASLHACAPSLYYSGGCQWLCVQASFELISKNVKNVNQKFNMCEKRFIRRKQLRKNGTLIESKVRIKVTSCSNNCHFACDFCVNSVKKPVNSD